MTTRKELQAWLDQFPEDAQIEVITSSESGRFGYEPYTYVYEKDMQLEPIPVDFISYYCGQTFEIEKFTEKFVVRLGRKDT